MHATIAFCPTCFGIFQSRVFPSGPNVVVSKSSESCIFCGHWAIVESNPSSLRNAVIEVLGARHLASTSAIKINQILHRLAANEVTSKQAEKEIDDLAPGLGSRIVETIREKGLIAIPIIIAALGVYAAFDANSISRESLDFQIQQAIEQSVSQDSGPMLDIPKPTKSLKPSSPNKKIITQGGVNDAGPHRPMSENRKMRRAEKAKKRRKK